MREITFNKKIQLAVVLSALLLTVLAVLPGLIFTSCGELEKDENIYTITFYADYQVKMPAMAYDPGVGGNVEIRQGIDKEGNLYPLQMIDRNVPLLGEKGMKIKTDGFGRVTKFPPNPQRPDGWSFLGWFTGYTEVTTNTIFTTNTRVTARWKSDTILSEEKELARRFDEIIVELKEGRANPDGYNVSFDTNQALKPKTLVNNGGLNITITLIGTVVAEDEIAPTITLLQSGSLFTVGNNVTLELRNVKMMGNDRNTKALLTVNNGGTLIIGDGSSDKTYISHNGAEDERSGGAVTVNKGGTLIMNGGGIYNCTVIAYPYEDLESLPGGGGVLVRGGTFTMTGGRIEQCFGRFNGGGVYVDLGGRFTMTGGTIYENSAPYGGGVLTHRGGLFEMRGGHINYNLAIYGAGVFVDQGAGGAESAHPYDPRRSANYPNMDWDGYPNAFNSGEPTNDARKKEGFYMSSATALISQNQALRDGGGVCNYQGGITYMTAGTVHDNTANGFGAGVYNVGLYIMMNGVISNNDGTFGGGVFADGGNFIMEDGDITSNIGQQFGGGVVVYDGQFTMHGGFIRNNNGSYYGGGVALLPSANAFAMSGGVISGNIATNGASTLYFYESNDPAQIGLAYYGTRPEFLNYNPDGSPAGATLIDSDTGLQVTYPPQRTVPGDPIVNARGYEDAQGKFRFTSLLADYAPNASGVLLPQDRHAQGNVAGATSCIRMEVADGILYIGTGNNNSTNKGTAQQPHPTGIVPGDL